MFANEPEMAKRWQEHTPKGKKLPERVVKKAFDVGVDAALERFGVKTAAEEIRLKIPTRQFHGLDAAWRSSADRAGRKMAVDHSREPLEPQATPEAPVEKLTAMLQGLKLPHIAGGNNAAKDKLDREVSWGPPSNMGGGDTANRGSDMGQMTGYGGAF